MKALYFLAVFVLISCCPRNEDCPQVEMTDWINGLSEKKLYFETKDGEWAEYEMGQAAINQQEEPDCNAMASTSCECPCHSSVRVKGNVKRSSNSFSMPLSISAERVDDLAQNQTERKHLFSFSGSSYLDGLNFFESNGKRLEEFGDTLSLSNTIVAYGDVIKLPLRVTSSIKNTVDNVYISRTEGIVGFSTSDKEIYYLVK